MGSAVKCPNCHQRINIPAQLDGQEFLCPMCKTRLASAAQPPPPGSTKTPTRNSVHPPTAPARQPAHSAAQQPAHSPPNQPAKQLDPFAPAPIARYPETRAPAQRMAYRSEYERSNGISFGMLLGVIAGGGLILFITVMISLAIFQPRENQPNTPDQDLSSARVGFQTSLTLEIRDDLPIPIPPNDRLKIVNYPSNVGMLSAYLSQPETPGQKYPAIIWKLGGFSNRIGTTVWSPQSKDNDQSAQAFRANNIITMYPALRGANGNPGNMEGFYGEVDDILAAAEFLAKQEFVDPNRIYLGGHSTGGTLALLCAASSNRFRAVFAFGPVDDIRGYGADSLPFDLGDQEELRLRNPINWLHAIQSPTFVIEGEYGNADSLRNLQDATNNSRLHFYTVPKQDHFEVLGPAVDLLADKVNADRGDTCEIQISDAELQALFE